jgi:hypothetical protein
MLYSKNKKGASMSLNTDRFEITDENLEKLLETIKNPINHRYSKIWLDDVDKNSDQVIGLEIVNDILCITIANYSESPSERTYKVVSEFAVDREALQSALDCLDIIEG